MEQRNPPIDEILIGTVPAPAPLPLPSPREQTDGRSSFFIFPVDATSVVGTTPTTVTMTATTTMTAPTIMTTTVTLLSMQPLGRDAAAMATTS
jgi:hypothetical protein